MVAFEGFTQNNKQYPFMERILLSGNNGDMYDYDLISVRSLVPVRHGMGTAVTHARVAASASGDTIDYTITGHR